jgi:hypothetical protein
VIAMRGHHKLQAQDLAVAAVPEAVRAMADRLRQARLTIANPIVRAQAEAEAAVEPVKLPAPVKAKRKRAKNFKSYIKQARAAGNRGEVRIEHIEPDGRRVVVTSSDRPEAPLPAEDIAGAAVLAGIMSGAWSSRYRITRPSSSTPSMVRMSGIRRDRLSHRPLRGRRRSEAIDARNFCGVDDDEGVTKEEFAETERAFPGVRNALALYDDAHLRWLKAYPPGDARVEAFLDWLVGTKLGARAAS